MNIKKYDKGHYYADILNLCTYCNPDTNTSSLNKTVMITREFQFSNNNPGKTSETTPLSANVETKLVGWLISFTHNSIGLDYKNFMKVK